MLPLGVRAAVSATNVAIQKKIYGSGMAAVMFSNIELDDILKIVTSLQDSGLLINGVSETVENEIKEQKGEFLDVLKTILGASLLENMLTGGGINCKIQEREATIPGLGGVWGGEGTIRAGEEQIELVRTFNAASSCN